MTIGQAVVWASQNIDPKEINPELTTSEPYVMGSHATCSGAWASGPEDYAPAEYQWGYNRMMTVEGLFGAGDAIGGSAHKFSSGSFTEGRIAGKAAVKYVNDLGKEQPQVSEAEYEDLKKIVYQPMENFEVGRNEIVAGTVSPSYLLPIHGLQRLEKIMDEYVGGISAFYTTNEPLLTRGLELLSMLKEDLAYLGAEDLHQLQRAWELATPGLGLGMRHAAHAVPDGNAVAGLLLPGRSSEAGRQGLALLHPVPLRPRFREVGDGEGSGVSHRRLITRLLRTLRLLRALGHFFHERQALPLSALCKGLPVRDGLISGRNRNVPTRAAAQFGAGQATVAAGDGAGRGTQAGGKTQENSSRLHARSPTS